MENEIEIIKNKIELLKKDIDLLNQTLAIVDSEIYDFESYQGDSDSLTKLYEKHNELEIDIAKSNSQIKKLNSVLSYVDKIHDLRRILNAIDKALKDKPNRYDSAVLSIKRESIKQETVYLEDIVKNQANNIKNKR